MIKSLVIVLGSLLVVCLAAIRVLFLLIRWLARRSKGPGREPARRPGAVIAWTERVVFVLAGLEVVAFAYALTVEPYWLQVTHTTVTVDALPTGTEPIRIVHITDLHSDPEARLEERLPDVIADLDPDMVVFTGDAINSPEALPLFQETMTRIARIAPTFAVRGNWDVWYWADLDLFGGTGVRELDGEAVSLPVAGAEVWIAGAAVGNEAKIERALGAVPHDALAVFLHHYPERVREAETLGADLVLSGDTHGGQVRLPLLGAVIEMVRFGSYYDLGLHHVGRSQLYVSRGIGMEGGHAPRVRFLCRPEVALLELVPGI